MSWSKVSNVSPGWTVEADSSNAYAEVSASSNDFEIISSLDGYVIAGYVTPYDVNGKPTGYVEPQEIGWERRDRATHEWSEA